MGPEFLFTFFMELSSVEKDSFWNNKLKKITELLTIGGRHHQKYKGVK